jgi:serine/threonine protein kinase
LRLTFSLQGTERYLAPELLLSEDGEKPSCPSDIYALGCVGLEVLCHIPHWIAHSHLFQFLFLQLPYAHRKSNRGGFIIKDVNDRIPPAVQPPNLPHSLAPLWHILDACWRWLPETRIVASELLTITSSLIHMSSETNLSYSGPSGESSVPGSSDSTPNIASSTESPSRQQEMPGHGGPNHLSGDVVDSLYSYNPQPLDALSLFGDARGDCLTEGFKEADLASQIVCNDGN